LRVLEIRPHRFRNLTPEPVSFCAGVNVLAGENGQGKTNVLEAVALLCGQRSFRGARSADIAADGEEFAVRGLLRRDFGSETLAVQWSRDSGRRFFQGEKLISFREASELAPAVFLAPEHRQLVTGSPGERRRFLDRLVLGLRPAAGDDLARYDRALAERNALLLAARGRVPDASELEAWTTELAQAGSTVRRRRREALAEWNVFFCALASDAGPEYAGLRADYSSVEDGVEQLLSECERLLPLERRRGFSLAGPHRDDLRWTRRGRPFAGGASAGEILRAVALAKLAEWHAVAAARGEPPLFGADDFDAGLSRGSVDALLDALPAGAMVLLTTASEGRAARRANQIIEIRAGAALPRRPAAVND